MTAADPSTEREVRWSRAYLFAVSNAALFSLLSLVSVGLGVTSIAVNSLVAQIFLAGSMIAAFLLIRAGEGLVAIGFFVAGTGITFGFGTAYATIVEPDYITRLLFYPDVQRELLSTINMINAISVLCVLLCAWPFTRFRGHARDAGYQIIHALTKLSTYSTLLIYASVFIVALEIFTFPVAENLLLRSAMAVLAKVPLATLVMVFALWSRQGFLVRILGCSLAVTLIGLGILTTAKTTALMPVISIIGGLWLNSATRRVAMVVFGVSVVAYFTLLAPLSHSARRSANYNGGVEGLSVAMQNLANGAQALDTKEMNANSLLKRFSSAPYQAYLVSQYRAGNRGRSLDDLWVALVPRAFWANKPNVTRFGADLYGEINQTTDVSSALAPTYSGEAYWNYGWIGLIFVSSLIGFQMGWLTQKWLDLVDGRGSGLGILVMAIPVALHGFWVETWVAATYVGGFVTLFILIKGLDAGVGFLESMTARASPAP